MNCPFCESTTSRVRNTCVFPDKGYRLRQHECSNYHKYITKEVVLPMREQEEALDELAAQRYLKKQMLAQEK